MRSLLKLAILASLALAATACQFPIFLPQFDVNTSGAGDNESGDVAIGEGGDFVVTWQEYDDEVLGRRFDRVSAPLGDPFPVNASTTNAQDESSIAMDAQGRFVAVWVEDGSSIWGRRFEADGTPLGGDFPVNTSTPFLVGAPHVASDPSGNFVVAWTAASELNPEVLARRFDSNGAPLSEEFQVNSFSTGYQAAGGAAMSPAGFVVSWGGEGFGNTNGIFARLFDPEGIPVTDDLEVNPDPLTTPEPSSPDVAMSAKGDFVVVWDDGNPTYRVAGRRWSVNGTPAGDVFPISEGTLDAREPRVTLGCLRQLPRGLARTLRSSRSLGRPIGGRGLPRSHRGRAPLRRRRQRGQPAVRGQQLHDRGKVPSASLARG